MSSQTIAVERRQGRRVGWAFNVFSSWAIALYAFAIVAIPAFRPPFAAELVNRWGGLAFLHFGGSAVALMLGALQFSQRIRLSTPAVHRWMGRVYVVGVLAGGIAGLTMATASSGGLVARVGFGALAVVWIWSTSRAYLAIRQRDVRTHRAWMFRSFALTYAAVTLRIYLPLSQIAGIPFDVAYPAIAWLCWVPNLFVADWLQRAESVDVRATRTAS